jgi:nitronate monooxygenase
MFNQLVPRLTDKLLVPIIATGGIGDARGITAAFSFRQRGADRYLLLRCPEAGTNPAWAEKR